MRDPVLILAANRLPGHNGRRKKDVLDACRDRIDFERIGGKVSPGRGRMARLLEEARREEAVLEEKGIAFTALGEEDYPPDLAEIYDPPLVLYRRGAYRDFDLPALGIVGTRRPTDAGRRQAFRLALEAGLAGIPVVSGLAYGIDGEAHQGGLAGKAPGIAVLAGGVDNPSPGGHRALARRILEQGGCLLGEVPPGFLPRRYSFPRRNRLLSGLCRGVVVVQAPRPSGALITADFALEQGRDLYVGSAGIQGPVSLGTSKLAEQGAGVVESFSDVLADWGREGPFFQAVPLGEPQSGGELARFMEGELAGRVHRCRGGYFEQRCG